LTSNGAFVVPVRVIAKLAVLPPASLLELSAVLREADGKLGGIAGVGVTRTIRPTEGTSSTIAYKM